MKTQSTTKRRVPHASRRIIARKFTQTGTRLSPCIEITCTLLHKETFKQFVAHCRQIIQDNGYHFFGAFDHHAVAPPESHLAQTTNLYFGRPEQGTPLMEAYPELAVKLPFCICVSQQQKQKTRRSSSNTHTQHVRMMFVNPFTDHPQWRQPALRTHKMISQLLMTLCRARHSTRVQ